VIYLSPMKKQLPKKERLGLIIKTLRVEVQRQGFEIPIVTAARGKYDSEFHILVTVLLTAQTKDAAVAALMPQIFAEIKEPSDLVRLSVGQIQKLIYPVSFYRNKAKFLRALGRILVEEHDGKVPEKFEDLVALPGVGEKTAYIVLHRAFGTHDGIGVDVHVHRISNRLGLIKTKTPKETEVALKKLLPRADWEDYNELLVNWGQNICAPLSPWCSKCALFGLCPRVGVGKRR